ncbi:MAG: DsbA family protein [Myxococcota bacterium]
MNADVRLRRLEAEYEGRVELRFKSFLLRPKPRSEPENAAHAAQALQKFRQYTRGWERIASEPDAGELRLWSTDEGPPSHSIPAHLVAKAAARVSRDAFGRMHERLLRAYFVESRDISREPTLRALWDELGLDEAGFEEHRDPALLEEVIGEHNEALRLGATGVPAVRLESNEAVIVGAQPAEIYRRWIERSLSRLEADA